MHCHHVLDALNGNSKYQLIAYDEEADKEQLLVLRERIAVAEKFNFVSVPLVFEESKFRLPKLTEDEVEAWNGSLIPLPAPACWYEFSLNGGQILGVLVINSPEHPDEWWIDRVDINNHAPQLGNVIFIDGIQVRVHHQVKQLLA